MLQELSECIGVSGSESKVRNLIKGMIENDVDDIVEDAYGNLIARNGKQSAAKILLAAHMDEVGFMITGISKDGFLKFRTIGIVPHVLLAKKLIVGTDEIPGVIGLKPIHHVTHDERKKLPTIDKLFIDIGACSKDEAQKMVEVGTHGTFDTAFSQEGDFIYGKAFDNRIGCYILIQLIKTMQCPCMFAFTTQEEVGLRGARIAAYSTAPRVAIAIDTTASGEWPAEEDVPRYPEIGKGPVLTIADRSIISDRKVVALMEQTARDSGIPYQYKKPGIGGTDAGAIHVSREGVRAAVIQTPARYIHSPLSIASMKDVDNNIALVRVSVERILAEGARWN